MTKLFFILSMLSIQVLAQFDDVLIGKPDNGAKQRNFNGFIGTTETALFALDYVYNSRKRQELNIRKFYKSNLEELESVDIFSASPEGYWSDPKEIFFQEGEFFLFTILVADKADSKLLRLEIFDQDVKRKADLIIDTLAFEENILFQEEENGDGFLVARYNKLAKIKDLSVDIFGVSREGSLLFQKRVKSPVSLQNFVIEKIIYKKDFPVFLLCNYSLLSNSASNLEQERLINNKYTVWAYDLGKDFLKEFEIRFNLKWANGVEMKLKKNDEVIVSGFVNETRNRAVNGTFALTLDKNLNTQSISSNSFAEKSINFFLNDKEKSKVKEIANIYLRDMVVLEDQSYFLFGEEYDVYVERNYDPRTNITTTTEHFYYNDVLVTYHDKNGKLKWLKRIPKEQTSTNDEGYFSSFTAFSKSNNVFLYFNDDKKNDGLAHDNRGRAEPLYEHRKSTLICVAVNADSIGTRKKVVPTDYDFLLRAKQSKQISEEMVFLQTEGRRAGKVLSIPLRD